jgi:hypothetical protein
MASALINKKDLLIAIAQTKNPTAFGGIFFYL